MDSPSSSSSFVSCEGWLEKKTKLGMWTKRYFVLKRSRLSVFRQPSEITPDAKFHLTSQTGIEICDVDSNRFRIVIPKVTILLLRAQDKNSMMKWVMDIRASAFSNPSLSMKMFNIIAVIGRGFYGKVMLCEKKDTKEIIAIKAIEKSKLKGTNSHQDTPANNGPISNIPNDFSHNMSISLNDKTNTVVNERNIFLESLNNPFIVQLKYAFQSRSKFYIGLEYCPGGDLFNRIKCQKLHNLHQYSTQNSSQNSSQTLRNKQNDKKITLNDIKLYIAEISIALNYLHQKKIIYRDIKPENILICSDGHVKLTDFGISKKFTQDDLENDNFDDRYRAKTFCGTTEYIAPEMILNQGYSFEIDWWGVGILTYEMLYNSTPFTGMNKSYIYQSIWKKEPTFPKNADPVVVEFIQKLLQKDPKERGGFEFIKNSEFFKGFDFADVYDKLICPDYIPELRNLKDTNNFDSKYTKEKPRDTFKETKKSKLNNPNESNDENDYLAGFEYYGEEILCNDEKDNPENVLCVKMESLSENFSSELYA
ncbi:AGC family protein kinase [Tritrichomonas foetus]|uniref:non-specific serine/threonine protein kinase n=1 Tax=Tritrichomonas foetus TaxID=1144522 RepID=A0A1J4KF48_9EUKA|nr:AGC family protein kinase [Tritrichomonas foetus]|eukprot:OHT10081.1 AGC family protein kinase [Tritrichomonas foetus]